MIWSWEYAFEVLPELLAAFAVTLEATLAGFALALVLGLVWAIARMAPLRWVSRTASAWIELVRSTPLLIQLYFLYYVLPEYGLTLSPLVIGVFALGMHYGCYTAEVYRAGIEAVPRGQWEAARALNLPRRAVWLRVVLPQAIPPTLPVLGNYLIAMFKDSPMLLAINVAELLFSAYQVGSRTLQFLEPITVVGLLFVVVSVLSSIMVRRLERRYATH